MENSPAEGVGPAGTAELAEAGKDTIPLPPEGRESPGMFS